MTVSIAPTAPPRCNAAVPRCDVYLFSRTGHWVQWERAAEFNAVLAAFLAEDHGA
jgi:4,5:9,10-diseco-3-hydroxy-5,9,17-trioxoandrosta-1(10),2-diene-4-oate hydrolase